jgi:hypothetical protein
MEMVKSLFHLALRKNIMKVNGIMDKLVGKASFFITIKLNIKDSFFKDKNRGLANLFFRKEHILKVIGIKESNWALVQLTLF